MFIKNLPCNKKKNYCILDLDFFVPFPKRAQPMESPKGQQVLVPF